MSAHDCSRFNRRGARQRGAAAVEFALVVMIFLVALFGIVELARLMFLYNTVHEATRRAADGAAAGSLSGASLDKVRQQAIFRTSPGGLVLMPTLTDQAIRIDFLSLARGSDGSLSTQVMASGAVPASAAENRNNCLIDPYGASCARLVRVRLCDPAAAASCTPLQFTPLVPLVPLHVALPVATTVTPVQALGSPN